MIKLWLHQKQSESQSIIFNYQKIKIEIQTRVSSRERDDKRGMSRGKDFRSDYVATIVLYINAVYFKLIIYTLLSTKLC
jgi:hypothetical protein